MKTQTTKDILTTPHNIADHEDLVRNAVLETLDTTCETLTGKPSRGWTDRELPALFAALEPIIRRHIAMMDSRE